MSEIIIRLSLWLCLLAAFLFVISIMIRAADALVAPVIRLVRGDREREVKELETVLDECNLSAPERERERIKIEQFIENCRRDQCGD